jgi:hypothetical protein
MSNDNCDKGLRCQELSGFGTSGNYCLGLEGTKCSRPLECVSRRCENGACTNKCTADRDCRNDDKYCDKSNKCVAKGTNGAKCDSYKQCSQIGAQRTCVNGLCAYHGAGAGQSCSGKTCVKGYYCDLKTNKCEKVSGGCVQDSDCKTAPYCCARTGKCVDLKIDC